MMGRRRRCIFPNGDDRGRYYLYVMGMDKGRVKVGMTRIPFSRMTDHRADHRYKVEWVHLFNPPLDARSAEICEKWALEDLEAAYQRSRGFIEVFEAPHLSRLQAIALVRTSIAEYMACANVIPFRRVA